MKKEIWEKECIAFGEILTWYIESKGLRDTDVYNNSNVSKTYFYKIKHCVTKNPSKTVLLSLAVGMRLSLDECVKFLSYNGYAFNPIDMVDDVFKEFISKEIYDINLILDALYDLELLTDDGEIIGKKVRKVY